jgi:hypothetical protein
MATHAIANRGTKQGNNLVLAGRRGGVTVVPQPTPLTRLHYFDGKFLRASDLELEQRYLRSLVALSNQAGGAGVVQGFSCTLAGDRLEVGPGLAIDPEGRALLLPEGRGVSLTELIEASRQSGALLLDLTPGPGGAGFGSCEELAAADGTAVADGSSLYLITLFHAEALCGEEDVLGKLCAEACATSIERPYVLEGVLLRAVPLTLATALATSGAVALTSRHLRSLVASAYFEDERRRVASLISGEGLASGAWCLGAAAAGGAGVPIALVSRAGATTQFLDAWTARRERMDAPSRRYWAGRMAMRPWDVFLAQVLQFQCQLTSCLGEPDEPGGGGDPCRQAWDLLRETSRQLARMIEGAAGGEGGPDLSPDFRQLDQLRGRLSDAAAGFGTASRERRLIACGIAELPSAGYLPVVARSTTPVNQQVRAWMGEGVDLRFCAVRPDFVPHALEEAQHMERISLLAGLDDPKAKPQVDVLVPDGELLSAGLPAGAGYAVEAALDTRLFSLLALLLRGGEEPGEGGAPAGRPVPSFAGAFEGGAAAEPGGTAGRAVALGRVLLAVAGAGRSGETPAGGTAFYHAGGTPRVAGFGPNDRFTARPGWLAASQARARRSAAANDAAAAGAAGEITIGPARAGATGELWVRLETDRDVFALARQGRARVTGELAVTVRADNSDGKGQGLTLRADLAGDLTVVARQDRDGGVQLAAELRGTLDLTGDFTGGVAGAESSRRIPLRESLLLAGTAGTGAGPEVRLAVPRLRLPGLDREVVLQATRRFTGPGRAVLEVTLRADAGTGGVRPPKDGAETAEIALAAATAERDDHVAEPAHRAHESSVSALRVLAATFEDPDYDDHRARLLFPGESPDTAELQLRAVHDWVLFHRRRTKNCGDIPGRPRTAARRYRVYYLDVSDLEQRDVVLRLMEEDAGLSNYPMEELGEVTFGGGVAALEEPPAHELRKLWFDAAPPGATLALAAIASREAAAADGAALAEARLGALGGVLDDHTPYHAEAEVAVLPGLPADLAVGDADGVIVLALIETAVTCQEVWLATEAQLEAARIEGIAREIGAEGLFPRVSSSLGLRLLTVARFSGGRFKPDDREDLLSSWQSFQRERPALFRDAVPVGIVVSAPGTAAELQPAQRAEGDDILAALTADGEVVSAQVNGGAEFPVDCPALTLVILQRGTPPAVAAVPVLVRSLNAAGAPVFGFAGQVRFDDAGQPAEDDGLKQVLTALRTLGRIEQAAFATAGTPALDEARRKAFFTFLQGRNLMAAGVAPTTAPVSEEMRKALETANVPFIQAFVLETRRG